MQVSMYEMIVPIASRMLGNLSAILEKGEAFAVAKKIEPSVLLNARLAPDMFALTRQVQIACDMIKGGAARLGGVEVPSHPDNETTFAELKARVAKVRDFINGIPAANFAGSENKPLTLKMRHGDRHFDNGLDYLRFYAMPNFYFHVTTTYAILRHNGVELGKSDFIGS
ncbi:MAG TPA: DUF1993 domain-containing protein [Rudaea sp.]|jgi:hypothetical protein|nr:DUF1993 domain-containing protein [Rudaea sp.]